MSLSIRINKCTYLETPKDFCLGFKVTADSDRSHEIKRPVLLERKAMTNLDSILKCRHYLANKGPSSQGYGFSSGHVWMWDWTIKKAEFRRINVFKLRCWRRLLRVPWTARRSNKSILKEINPEYSLEGLMLKVKLQYFGHLMWRADSSHRDAGKDWGQEEKGTTEDEMVGWHHWFDGQEFEQTPRGCKESYVT